MIVDTHAHYDDEKFDTDREELLKFFESSGNYTIINPGCDIKSSISAVDFSKKYQFMYAAVGIHPEELPDDISSALIEIDALSANSKCVAIGEIGLDYYWDSSQKEKQKELFILQLQLAEKRNLPVIIHDREAHRDCMEIVSAFPNIRGVFHCYSGSAEMARQLIKMGWYLGFDGPITYKNARKSLEVLAECPAERILIETDSPYLPPAPLRGTRNDSGNLSYISEIIASVKGISTDEVYNLTAENASRLFELKY